MAQYERTICPSCSQELDSIYHARSVKLKWGGAGWVESDVYHEEITCPNCDEEIPDDILNNMGRPLHTQ